MKRLLLASAVALTLTTAMGNARADVDVDVLVENLTTGESGSNVSAAAGDQVALHLAVTNTGADQKVAITVLAGTIDCAHEVSINRHFKSGQTRTKRVKGRIADGHQGTLIVSASALGDDGCSDNDDGALQFGVSKPGASAPAAGGMFQRIFTRMLANGLVDLASEPTRVQSTFSEFKQLYR